MPFGISELLRCNEAIPDGYGGFWCRKDGMSCVHPFGPCYGMSDKYSNEEIDKVYGNFRSKHETVANS
jgi:hypothetical protein